MKRSPSSSGFTLVELLVFISLLALLAALLFPVLAQARDLARETTCLSNLRQITGAYQLYVQDWDERLPHWFFTAPPRPEPRGDFQYWSEFFQPYLRGQTVLRDPGARWPWIMPEEEKLADYSLATWGNGGRGTRASPHWQWPGWPLTLGEVRRPADTLIVVDGWTEAGWTSMDFYRHRGWIQAAFMDGHATRISIGEFWRVGRSSDGSYRLHYGAADRD